MSIYDREFQFKWWYDQQIRIPGWVKEGKKWHFHFYSLGPRYFLSPDVSSQLQGLVLLWPHGDPAYLLLGPGPQDLAQVRCSMGYRAGPVVLAHVGDEERRLQLMTSVLPSCLHQASAKRQQKLSSSSESGDSHDLSADSPWSQDPPF